jgi:hypothetical protein
MSDNADVVVSPSPSDRSLSQVYLNAINPLVAFYDIYGRNREVLFFYFAPDTTRDYYYYTTYYCSFHCTYSLLDPNYIKILYKNEADSMQAELD